MAMRPNSEMSPPTAARPSEQRDAVIQELRRGAQLAALLRQQVELVPELDLRHAAVANASDISTALLSSLSVLEREQHSSSSSSGAGVMAHAEPSSARRSADGAAAGVGKRAVGARARKARQRWSKDGEELPIIREISTETPENDRFHWRKYGEKKILGADFPRLYYRCGYSDQHKCPAKKYVQQQNTSSPRPVFMVTLINEHTCDTLFPADQPPCMSSSGSTSQLLDFTKASISSPAMEAAAAGGAGLRLKKEEDQEAAAAAASVTTPGYSYEDLSSSLLVMSPEQWQMEMEIKSFFHLDSADGELANM